MTALELIARLKKMVDKYGDRPVTLLVEVKGPPMQIEDALEEIAFSRRTGFKLLGRSFD